MNPKVYLWGLLWPSFCSQPLHSQSETAAHPLLADSAAARCAGKSGSSWAFQEWLSIQYQKNSLLGWQLILRHMFMGKSVCLLIAPVGINILFPGFPQLFLLLFLLLELYLINTDCYCFLSISPSRGTIFIDLCISCPQFNCQVQLQAQSRKSTDAKLNSSSWRQECSLTL